MRLEITRARREHVPDMLRITNDEASRSLATAAYSDEPLHRWIEAWEREHDRYPWLVALSAARDEEVVVGYAKASPFNPREGFQWSVSLSVYLSPEAQGQGLGVALYERLFTLLKAQGFRSVYARIALPNPASYKLHERFGLTQTGLLPQFSWKFERWYDLAILTARLGDLEGPPSPLRGVDEVWSRSLEP